jgi:type VI secretion system secreted protein Hcp
MAFDTFLFLEGINGESTAVIQSSDTPKGMEGIRPFELFSWSFGASNPSTVGSGKGGLSAGKVQVSSFNVQKKSEDASPQLFMNCCTGQHIGKAAVIMRKAGGKDNKQMTFIKYEFTHVMVDSIMWSGHAGGDDTPSESITFAFATVAITNFRQDQATGRMGVGAGATWDLTKVTT